MEETTDLLHECMKVIPGTFRVGRIYIIDICIFINAEIQIIETKWFTVKYNSFKKKMKNVCKVFFKAVG